MKKEIEESLVQNLINVNYNVMSRQYDQLYLSKVI